MPGEQCYYEDVHSAQYRIAGESGVRYNKEVAEVEGVETELSFLPLLYPMMVTTVVIPGRDAGRARDVVACTGHESVIFHAISRIESNIKIYKYAYLTTDRFPAPACL